MPTSRCSHFIICFGAVAIVLAILAELLHVTPHGAATAATEGFKDAEGTPTAPQISQQLLSAVMPPIRRLASTLINPTSWTERFAMMDKTPAEMARAHLLSQK